MSHPYLPLLRRVIERPDRCENRVTQKEAFIIATEIMNLKAAKSWPKEKLCKAILNNWNDDHERAIFGTKREAEEEKQPIRVATPPKIVQKALLVDSIRKQVLGKSLYDVCVERGGKISRKEVLERFDYLKKEGLFTNCDEDDFIKICDLKENPKGQCQDDIEGNLDALNSANECGVCMEVEDAYGYYKQRLPCGHYFHGSCVYKSSPDAKPIHTDPERDIYYVEVKCPLCRAQAQIRRRNGKWEFQGHPIKFQIITQEQPRAKDIGAERIWIIKGIDRANSDSNIDYILQLCKDLNDLDAIEQKLGYKIEINYAILLAAIYVGATNLAHQILDAFGGSNGLIKMYNSHGFAGFGSQTGIGEDFLVRLVEQNDIIGLVEVDELRNLIYFGKCKAAERLAQNKVNVDGSLYIDLFGHLSYYYFNEQDQTKKECIRNIISMIMSKSFTSKAHAEKRLFQNARLNKFINKYYETSKGQIDIRSLLTALMNEVSFQQ